MTRPEPATVPCCGARGAALGALAWATVVAAHVAASGALPSLGTLLATAALAAAIGGSFAGRQLTWRRSFGALLVLQPTLHLALTTLAAGAHHHHHAFHDAAANWTMVGAHIGAAAVAAWWLSAGDALLLRAVQFVQSRLRVPAFARLSAATPRRSVTGTRAAAVAAHAQLVGSVTRRGPPEALVPAGH